MGLFALLLLPRVLTGCATGGTSTWVEGGLMPSHFQFKDVVPKTVKGPDGWRAACLHVGIARGTTEELFYCRFGVEVPIENEKQGAISIEQAQRLSASCANLAATTTLATVTPATPLGIGCEEFKKIYGVMLNNAIAGARVMRTCHPGVPPVIVTPRVTPGP
jgi:hypothetical protein